MQQLVQNEAMSLGTKAHGIKPEQEGANGREVGSQETRGW
jgi:hypothetical protein